MKGILAVQGDDVPFGIWIPSVLVYAAVVAHGYVGIGRFLRKYHPLEEVLGRGVVDIQEPYVSAFGIVDPYVLGSAQPSCSFLQDQSCLRI